MSDNHGSYPTAKIPENCTLCGGSFEKDGKSNAFPWPPNHYLCVGCMMKSSGEGLERLNKRLATGELDLSVEEIAKEIEPEDIQIAVSMDLLRSKIPEIVYEMEDAHQGIIGDYPDITEYMLEVQEFFRNCVGFQSSPTTARKE